MTFAADEHKNSIPGKNMKNLILIYLFTFIFIHSGFAMHEKIMLIEQGNGPFQKSKSFKLRFCEEGKCHDGTELERQIVTEKVVETLSKKLLYEYYTVDSKPIDNKLSATDLVATLEHLIEDYSNSNGSPAWEEKEIITIMNFIRKNGKSVAVYNLAVTLNKKQKLNFQKDILIFNAATGNATFVPRTTLVE